MGTPLGFAVLPMNFEIFLGKEIQRKIETLRYIHVAVFFSCEIRWELIRI